MNDTIAALLYLLGRHVTTALRVRREDEEIVLNRHQAPPLRELHDTLERGEQLAIDPWVDLDDGGRGLVCLWARTPCPEVTVDDLPEALRPQAWVRQGGSALAVWSLAEPTGAPGGADPVRAMRDVAAALGITACDPRDYIPVPRDPQDLVIIEPGRDIDATQLLQWAQADLADRHERQRQRREQEEAVRRVALYPPLLRAIAAVAEARREYDEAASRMAIAPAERGDVDAEDLPQPHPGMLAEPAAAAEPEAEHQPVQHGDEDHWTTLSEDRGAAGPRDPATVSPAEPRPAEHADVVRAAMLARSERTSPADHDDDHAAAGRSRLAQAIAEAREGTWDETRFQTTLVALMAEMGTREVWTALSVDMTQHRDGLLYGLRGGRWMLLRDALRAAGG